MAMIVFFGNKRNVINVIYLNFYFTFYVGIFIQTIPAYETPPTPTYMTPFDKLYQYQYCIKLATLTTY